MEAVGYTLSSEEHAPPALVHLAERAESLGFAFAMISDHYHPWTARQGQSGFVWAVLGAIAQATSTLRVGTGVTCPILRLHPALIAQASATAALLFDGRFMLGIGAGENLNEHILGDRWPRPAERHARVTEAIDIIRRLWAGGEVSYSGEHYLVDQAQLWSLPAEPPPLLFAASGPDAAALAAAHADGLVATSPDSELVKTFRQGGRKKPAYAQVTLCYAPTVEEAEQTVHEWWPQTGLSGDLSWELKTPELIETACKPLSREQAVEHISCGPDPERHLEAIRRYEKAGFDHIYLHQVGPDQEAFFDFFEDELEPRLS